MFSGSTASNFSESFPNRPQSGPPQRRRRARLAGAGEQSARGSRVEPDDQAGRYKTLRIGKGWTNHGNSTMTNLTKVVHSACNICNMDIFCNIYLLFVAGQPNCHKDIYGIRYIHLYTNHRKRINRTCHMMSTNIPSNGGSGTCTPGSNHGSRT